MFKRPPSQSRRHLAKSQQGNKRHNQRLRNIDQADFTFKEEVEECTNFTMRRPGPAKDIKARQGGAGKSLKQRPSTTILSQVKRYGREGESKIGFQEQYVQTTDGVTDDAQNYLPRKTEEFKEFSHIFPEAYKQAQEQLKGKKRGKVSQKNIATTTTVKIEETPFRQSQQQEEQQQSDVKKPNPFSFSRRAGSIDEKNKPLLGQSSSFAIKKEVNNFTGQKKDKGRNQLVNQIQTGSNNASSWNELHKIEMVPIIEKLSQQQHPRGSSRLPSATTHDIIAQQIREKAGSSSNELLLNEDSEGAFEPQLMGSTRSLVKSSGDKLATGEQQKFVSSFNEEESHAAAAATAAAVNGRRTNNGKKPSTFSQDRHIKKSTKGYKETERSSKREEMQKILDHVHQENKRLWRLYDNQLDGADKYHKKHSPERASYNTATLEGQKSQGKFAKTAATRKQSANLHHCDSEQRNLDFMNAVKNHTVYRRDKFVRNLSNQIKRNFDPYLRFQIKEKKDPFAERPLSSVIKRAGALYPSRDAIARANATDDAMPNRSSNFNSVKQTARPGQTRPMSSNYNQLLLLKESKNAFSNDIDNQTQRLNMRQSQPLTLAGGRQHQRLQSYQMNKIQQKDHNQPLSKNRPGSSGIAQTTHLTFLSANMNQKTGDKTELTSVDLAGGRDDLVNIKQTFDPSANSQNPLSFNGGGKPSNKLTSDAEFQSAVFSAELQNKGMEENPQLLQQTGSHEALTAYESKKAITRPQSSPYSLMGVSQPTSATRRAEVKSTQNLISQLRIKSVRQSKVRIVKDPSSDGHFDVMVDHLIENQKGWIPSRHTTSRIKIGQDKMVSNATNLNRSSGASEVTVTAGGAGAQSNFQMTPFISSNASREQLKQSNSQEQLELTNDFADNECTQLDIKVLHKYGVIKHMHDFLYFSETQSPVFVYTPSHPKTKADAILVRFRSQLEAGEVEQSASILDLGMKEKHRIDAFKLNAGVIYLMKQQYLEAVQTFRQLAKRYPVSSAIQSNLLFAYLCDGWVNNVKEFQSTALFKSIRAPLSLQTKSILELIKYTFQNPDSINFSQNRHSSSVPRRSSKYAAKFAATQVFNSKDFSNGFSLGEEHHKTGDSRINEQSGEFEQDDSELSQNEVAAEAVENSIGYSKYFKKNRRIKDFTKRETMQSMGQILRQKLRKDRQGFLGPSRNAAAVYDQQEGDGRPRTFSPVRRSRTFGEREQPDYLQLYKGMLAEYHRKDKQKHKTEMAVFEKLLDKLHKLCNDEEHFQTGIVTKIVKPADKIEMKETTKKSSRRFTARHLSSERVNSTNSAIQQSEKRSKGQQQGSSQFKVKQTASSVLKKVKKVEEEELNRGLLSDDEEGLDNIFKQLVALRTTYISESVADPIESSYFQLIEGLGIFHEKYNVRTFIDRYMEMLADIKQSEEITEMKNAAGGKWKVDQDLLDKVMSKVEHEVQFLAQFPCFDEQVDRARTFILSILHHRTLSEIPPLKKLFEDLAYFADDKKRAASMEQDRYNLEQSFIKIIREFILVQQELAQRIKTAKSIKIVQEMTTQSEVNEQYIKLCLEMKDMAGRHDETVLINALEISKVEHAARGELGDQVNSPLNEKTMKSGPLSPEKIKEHKELYTKGWEKFTYRELPVKQKLKIAEDISKESDDLLKKARLRVQKEIDEKNKKSLSFKAQLQMQREEERRAFEARREVMKKAKKVEQLKKVLLKKMGIVDKIKVAVHSMQDYEFDLVIQKLNLDAVEIKSILPNSYTQGIGLWEESAALKVIKQKIESINETVKRPEMLFEKDELKHRPLLEKWNNQGQLNHSKTSSKAFSSLPTHMRNELKEDKMKIPDDRKHWQVRPKIGHEVTDNQINLIEESLSNWQEISQAQKDALDVLLTKNNRFFSIFDGPTRREMYEYCVVNRHIGTELEIERDVEETENIQILLRGNIHIVQVNDELDIKLRLASLRAGETCGDQAIQRKIGDPLKVLSKERKTAVTNSEETITITIKRERFMEALFQEMDQELFYKIILLRNTPFFQELSPYSLTIIASNVEVREVKYGEIVVQQGVVPDALYILAYGECKTLYQYLEQKSTKVSKFANKCLKSDLPAPIHTGLLDYSTMPKEALEKHAKSAMPRGPDDDSKDAKKKTKGDNLWVPRTSSPQGTRARQVIHAKDTHEESDNGSQLGPQQLNTKFQNTLKAHEGLEKKLQKVPNFPIRSFYHSVTNENKRQMTIQFNNQMVYSQLKVGQAFGMRALLDPLICKKHIVEKKQMFSDKLGLNLNKLWEELIKQNQLSLNRASLRKVKRKEANKQAQRFCKKCFEERNPHCKCQLNQLSPREATKADQERAKAAVDSESSFYEEFNDSHEYDDVSSSASAAESTKNNDQDQQQLLSPISTPQQVAVKKLSKYNKDLREITKSPDRAYEGQRDKIKEQIDKLMETPKVVRLESKTQVAKKKTQHKEHLQRRVEEQFSTKLYTQLMKAQVSITVTSATAKFLVIKKEDKGLLNEYLRVCIDRAILETNFADLDRPENSHHDVQHAVHMSRGWTTFKEQFMNDIMKETKMSKKANKLLDD